MSDDPLRRWQMVRTWTHADAAKRDAGNALAAALEAERERTERLEAALRWIGRTDDVAGKVARDALERS